jgi:hypothetical protein
MRRGMESGASYSLDHEGQFWEELDNLLATQCDSHAAIDNVLRLYLGLTTKHKDVFLPSASDISQCCRRLLASPLFSAHADYIRRQIVYSLLQEDAPDNLVVIASLLLHDGRENETTLEMISSEGGFVRLLELIQLTRSHDADLHRLLMDLMYEMSRIQRLGIEDLGELWNSNPLDSILLSKPAETNGVRNPVLVDDDFVKYLFEIIEEVSNDVNDPYHYSVIRVLVSLAHDLNNSARCSI